VKRKAIPKRVLFPWQKLSLQQEEGHEGGSPCMPVPLQIQVSFMSGWLAITQ
jgi:hypothetical protein